MIKFKWGTDKVLDYLHIKRPSQVIPGMLYDQLKSLESQLEKKYAL